jgi:hypothetical protein
MQRKTVLATIIAAAFVLPFAATAGTDKHMGAKATSATTGAHDGGAHAMFRSLDKDADGFISREEASNTPNFAAEFASLDTNVDGKLSTEEHAYAKQYAEARAAARSDSALGATSPATSSGMKAQ